LYEGNLHSFRQIFLNRDHPKDLNPTWWGDSVGKWEGRRAGGGYESDLNGLTWLDRRGRARSDKLARDRALFAPGLRQPQDEITIEDPVYYSRPFKVTQWTPLITDSDL